MKEKIKTKNNPSSSVFVVCAVLLMGGYFYYSSVEKKETINISTSETEAVVDTFNSENEIKVSDEAIPAEENKIEANVSPNAALVERLVETKLPTAKEFMNDPEPMLKKIHNLTKILTTRHEDRIEDVLKQDKKETLFTSYMKLKNERGVRFFEQIKIDNSPAANQRINSEYQGKLYTIFGKETYEKYKDALKKSNMESRAYNIIFDF